MLYTIGCTREGKLPTFTVSVVEKFRRPDCTYRLTFNASIGYDPIVLEQIHYMTMSIRGIGTDFFGHQIYVDPYNTVSHMCHIYHYILYVPYSFKNNVFILSHVL